MAQSGFYPLHVRVREKFFGMPPMTYVDPVQTSMRDSHHGIAVRPRILRERLIWTGCEIDVRGPQYLGFGDRKRNYHAAAGPAAVTLIV